MKVVINACHGGFGLSAEAMRLLGERGCSLVSGDAENLRFDDSDQSKSRTDSAVIEVVESLGGDASDKYAKLKIVEVPDGIDWEISEYDGWEQVEEKHQSWG